MTANVLLGIAEDLANDHAAAAKHWALRGLRGFRGLLGPGSSTRYDSAVMSCDYILIVS